jgi:hypothetical protein
MGGPCKATGDRNKIFTQENVAGKAKPRHRGPSLEEGNLTARIVAYNKLHDKAPYHKPGSTNRHKS